MVLSVTRNQKTLLLTVDRHLFLLSINLHLGSLLGAVFGIDHSLNKGMPNGDDEFLNGSHCFDTNNELWVKFKSPSDALFAQLSLVHDIPITTIDLMLKVVRHAAFNPSELSFELATDISDVVSTFRRATGGKRSEVDLRKNPPQVPLIVVESVVESLAQDLDCLENATEQEPMVREQEEARNVRATLRTLCLVHRSWTPFAQNSLRKRVTIRGEQKLQLFLRSPFCGPWVEHVRFFHRTLGNRSPTTWYLLSAFINRTKQLKTISFSSAHIQQANEGITAVLTSLRSLTFSLTVLRMSTRFSCSVPHLVELYELLGTLRCLEVLEVSGWICHDNGNPDAVVPDHLLELSPPSTLKRLTWEQRNLSVPLNYLSWLLSARDRYYLTRLTIRFTEGPRAGGIEMHKFKEALLTTLPYLESLDITIWSYLTLRPRYNRAIQSILSETTNLRHLSLRYLSDKAPGEVTLRLPRSLETLRLMALEIADDGALADILRENAEHLPRFSKIIIPGHSEDFFETETVCSDYNIAIEFT